MLIPSQMASPSELIRNLHNSQRQCARTRRNQLLFVFTFLNLPCVSFLVTITYEILEPDDLILICGPTFNTRRVNKSQRVVLDSWRSCEDGDDGMGSW
ncbi:unnamed protein product [Allacma fusca]|uniref:Uncharacterized protein n=1 Tax=Allacma fusca TaxID=39272 RepID=A0A8J2KKH2_9HEXA|nr:unnamed protein product [Allacma fusca]